MLEGNTQHPTAEAIHERVREVMPTVSLTTVYKTLNELVHAGELKRFDVDGVSHFDPNTAPHGEAVCLRCGLIVDVDHAAPNAAAEGKGFQVRSAALTFYGYCRECAAMGVDSSCGGTRRD
jgi:Fe2+ or Zn2+ uptake regulation protein